MADDPTIVEYFSEHERYKCGYCGSQDTNYSHGMWAHQMTVQDYQDLIDRGWRRSGKYCYKPTMKVTCCPQYTIKCDTSAFKLNKSHKKVLKKVNKFLITGVKSSSSDSESKADNTEKTEGESEMDTGGASKSVESSLAEKAQPSEVTRPQGSLAPNTNNSSAPSPPSCKPDKDTPAVSTPGGSQEEPSSEKPSTALSSSSSLLSKSNKSLKSGSGADPSKPPCRKAKDIRAERSRMKKGEAASQQKKPKQSQEKSLEDWLGEPDKVENPAHKLEIKLIRSAPGGSEFQKSFLDSYAIYKKYQIAVHKDKDEDCEKSGFKSFLVDSPLEPKWPEGGLPEGYGSFHQHYILDGKIIAVGVIDVLPSCISSVYLYYDPDYSFLGLGVYSALREIAFVRSLTQVASGLKNYYMGFYIHSCDKMRYKGQYIPSFISCPETYNWVAIETCRPKLDASNYARLEEDGVEDKDKDIDLNQVLCLHQGTMLPYAFYKMMKSKSRTPAVSTEDDEVKEYAGFVGKTCAERMLLVRK